MKKLIFILTTILLFVACNDSVTISKDEYNKLKGVKQPRSFTVNNETYLIYTGSDEHDYYPMSIGTGGYSSSVRYFHYADCVKCKKDTIR